MKSEDIIELLQERAEDFRQTYGLRPSVLFVSQKVWFSRAFMKACQHHEWTTSWSIINIRALPTVALKPGYVRLAKGDIQVDFELKKRLPFADELPGRKYSL